MNNWDDLKLILALSRYGTMSSAARALGLNTATVSRRLERCAKDVGETLFVRRGQVWDPTPKGLALIELAESVTDGFLLEKQHLPSGELDQRTIRISMPIDICLDALAPRIRSFLQENPGLTLDLFHEEKSIAFGEVDLRFGYDEPLEGRLVRSKLGVVGYRGYKGRSMNASPQGWVEILGLDRVESPIKNLTTEMFGPPRLKTTSVPCAAELVQTMPLIVYLPTRYAERIPDLVAWDVKMPVQHFPIWASYHESRRLDPDVRTALNFMKKCFEHKDDNTCTLGNEPSAVDVAPLGLRGII